MKGCQKRIIVMKNTGSNIFDEVYFILKDNAVRTSSMTENDMVSEASRIVMENLIIAGPKRPGPAPRPSGYELYRMLRWYVAGVITTALICAAAILLL